jgi:hypothetical protein
MTDDPAIQWLHDAPHRSREILRMLDKTTPANGTAFYKPNSVDDLQAALQHCLDEGKMLMLDPTTRLTGNRELRFIPRGHPFPHGISAYGAQFTWQSDGKYDTTWFNFETEANTESRNLTINGLSFLGDSTSGSAPPCGKLVRLAGRNHSAIRGFSVDDLNFEHCGTALWMEAEVFEGYARRIRGTYARYAGVVCRHGYEIDGVLSNVYILEPNITRCSANMGESMGILCDRTNSVIIDQGNFISLDGPAIKATNGVKRLSDCDFENTGNVRGNAIEIDGTDYWSQVLFCEGSNTQGNMNYLVAYGDDEAKLDMYGCRMWGGELVKLTR